MNKIGIVISTYQRPDGRTPELLSRCLNSIKDQKYQNYKVFLIGDKYEDDNEFNTFGVDTIDLEKLYKRNLEFAKERDKYSNTNKNALWSYGGVNAANTGIDKALEDDEIDYICRLDHDDYWGPSHLDNFNNLIEKMSPDWMCSVSTYINGYLPSINNRHKTVPFLPGHALCIKSSTCINQRTIPLRTIDLYKEFGEVRLPADADLWERTTIFIKENSLKSIAINELTCFHDEEGYSKS